MQVHSSSLGSDLIQLEPLKFLPNSDLAQQTGTQGMLFPI
jgi:hypothetical protein